MKFGALYTIDPLKAHVVLKERPPPSHDRGGRRERRVHEAERDGCLGELRGPADYKGCFKGDISQRVQVLLYDILWS